MRLKLLLLLLTLSVSSFASDITLPEGKSMISCECILAISGCSLSILHKAAQSPLHSWVQEINIPPGGKKLDLAKNCYRKRNEDRQGTGLCCESSSESDDDIKKVFRGTLTK